jgi:neutral ceramidase
MGYSFAAGTTDGPGAFDFQQGETKQTPFWNLVRDFIRKPSAEMIQCQHPKPILVATGEMKFPYQWQPNILPLQLFKIGPVVISGLPGEFTTMAGRRLKALLKEEFKKGAPEEEPLIMLSGLSNAYSSYVVTYEEYQVQRYEGASTIFGPHTLDAYLQLFKTLATHLSNKLPIGAGPDPPNLIERQICLKPGVIYDGAPFGKKFGTPIYNPKPQYKPGETVYVSFVAGHPRNDLKTESSFLSVEKLDETSNKWKIVATDGNWETKFYWVRTNTFFAESQAIIIWDSPKDAKPGTYRIRHFGANKNLAQKITSYVGVSNNFKIA